MGMKESENGEWVEYSLYLSERRLLEEIAKSRLETIHERNEEIITLKEEIRNWQEWQEKSEIQFDRINNEYISLDGFVKSQDNTINNLNAINKKLKIESKFTDLKHDAFIFSVSLNIVFFLYTIVVSFGGIQ